MTLTDNERAVCAAIIDAPEAWVRRDGVAAPEVDGLIGAAVLATWDRPDYQGLTLTPYGAALLGVRIEEKWRPAVEERQERDDARPLAGAAVVRERVLTETPVWAPAGKPEAPVKLPRHARIGRTLAHPERVAAPEAPAAAEFVVGEDGAPLTIMGRPVRAVRGLKGKR